MADVTVGNSTQYPDYYFPTAAQNQQAEIFTCPSSGLIHRIGSVMA
jgi:hypothetical protein